MTDLSFGDIDINDGTNYHLKEGWQPQVTSRRVDEMAGGGPFAEVDEFVPLRIFGTNEQAALAALGALARESNTASRWQRNHSVTARLLTYKVNGGARVLKCPAWPIADLVRMPVTFNEWINAYEINPVDLPLRRSGLWLQDDYEEDNPILNSSFEVGANPPTNWTKNGTVTGAQTTSGAFHGSYAINLTAIAGSAMGIYQDVSGLTVAAQYRVSVYVTPTTGTAQLRVHDGGGFINTVTASSSGTALQRLEVTKTIPAGGSVRIEIGMTAAGGNVKFDAVKIELGTTATDYHPKESEVMTAVATAAANPSIIEASFAVSGIPSDVASPIKVELGGFGVKTLSINESFLVLVSDDDDTRFRKATMSSMTATGYTDVADTAANADAGTVLRYTPTVTTFVESGAVPIGGLPFDFHRLAFLATIRNNDTTKTYRVKIRARPYAGSTYYVETEETIIDVSDTNPHPYYLGMVDGFDSYEDIKLVIAASATGSTLDIDTLLIVPLYDEGVHILKIDPFETDSGAYVTDIVIDTAALTKPEPKAYAALSTADELPIGVAGDDYVTMHGLSVKACWLACDGTNWVHMDTQGTPAVIQNTLDITRQLAFLTPE